MSDRTDVVEMVAFGVMLTHSTPVCTSFGYNVIVISLRSRNEIKADPGADRRAASESVYDHREYLGI
jgi:hypothetical protein